MADTEVTRAEHDRAIAAERHWHGWQTQIGSRFWAVGLNQLVWEFAADYAETVRQQTAKAIAQKLRERAVVLRKKIRQGKFNKGELLAGAIELEIAVKEIEREYEVK